jgi:hypothetical protein
MRVRLRATVDVVNQHVEVADAIHAASHAAASGAQSVVKPLLSG